MIELVEEDHLTFETPKEHPDIGAESLGGNVLEIWFWESLYDVVRDRGIRDYTDRNLIDQFDRFIEEEYNLHWFHHYTIDKTSNKVLVKFTEEAATIIKLIGNFL